MLHPAIFLDRDGTIIEDTHYPSDPNLVVLLPGAAAALKLLRSNGYKLFVVSNQSGVGRGWITQSQFEAVHARFDAILKSLDIDIDGYFYCLHAPEVNCTCRKPAGGAILSSPIAHHIDWSRSLTVGDRECDLFLSKSIGAQRACLVLTGKGKATHQSMTGEQLAKFEIYSDLITLARGVTSTTSQSRS